MYIKNLTAADIDFGRVLWQSLHRNRTFRANGALWFQSESGEWNLLIATPRVDEIGRRRAYLELAKIANRILTDSGKLLKVELISPKLPLYRALRSVFGKTASVEGARLGNTQIDGMYIDDAFLYAVG